MVNHAAWDFLASRRSTPPKLLKGPAPERPALDQILTLAARSPDHGMLVPWRFIVLTERALRRLGGEIAARGERHGFDPEQIEKGRAVYDTSPLAVVVVAAPVYSDKIPKVEQIHSAGAVCLSLVNAALAAGWGAGWVTGWVAHDRRFLPTALGLTSAESIAGIVHIGTPPGKPPERPRPDIAAITTWAGG
jgi:nitroreductase